VESDYAYDMDTRLGIKTFLISSIMNVRNFSNKQNFYKSSEKEN
jgi:hypothetical protein